MITNPDIYPYLKGIHLKKMPIKIISDSKQSNFINLVDSILVDPANPPEEQISIELEIDDLVFDLYELTDEERQLVRDTVA